MLTIQVAEVEVLKNNLLPLLQISHHADFRFSRSTVSFTVAGSHNSSLIFARLEVFHPFFILLSSNHPREFHSCIQIDSLFLATFITGTDDRLLTIFMPDDHTFSNLVFTTCVGHLEYCSPMQMGPPLNIQVASMAGGIFVAVNAEWFRDVATRLSAFSTKISVTAKDSEVKFCAAEMDFVIPIEGNRCRVEGTLGGGVRFEVSVIPLQFFIRASQLDKMVYFYGSTEKNTLVVFETGYWTNIVASNPQDRWEQL
ncbi:uncharacterized protein LOC111464196 [Cucurbita moschata]|uniref:Uncharacterized protein LOC111464196 n=1 Tax=Cucurbita moschata TaxID=3662 RepID=A0A6J1HGS5_CUCMO|nr:uncharacterized protein LOC111464196 [Cucurbita moschata]